MRKLKQKGFSLIEMVIAIVVLTIAVGTLLVVFGDVLSSTVMPEIVNVSSELAERELERVSGLRFSSVVNEGPTSYTGSFSNYSYQVTVSAVPLALANDAGMTQYKQVAITVSHATAGAVTLTTVVTNN